MTEQISNRNMAKVLELLAIEGLLDLLLRRGIISPTILEYRDIYYYYDSLMKTQGMTRNQAVNDTAAHFNTVRSKVYRAIKAMQ